MKRISRLPTVLILLFCAMCFSTTDTFAQSSEYTVSKRYNLLGQLTGEIFPDPDGDGPLGFPATRYHYQADTGLLEKVESSELKIWQSEHIAPENWDDFRPPHYQFYRYDDFGRKIAEGVATQDGNITNLKQFSYDLYGQLDCETQRLNTDLFQSPLPDACTTTEGEQGFDRVTRYVYSRPYGQLIEEHRGVGTSLAQTYATHHYDDYGRRWGLTDANGNRTEYAYDHYNRIERAYFPDKATGTPNINDYERYEYDKNGNRTLLRTRDNKTIIYAYDKLNRLINKDLEGGNEHDVYYDYDHRGLPLYARFTSHSGKGITHDYDGHGRLFQEHNNTTGQTRTLTHAHDEHGNRLSLTFPDQTTLKFGYDTLDRLTDIRNTDDTPFLTHTYDELARLKNTLRANQGATTTLNYDGISRLGSIGEDFSGSDTDVAFIYSYNPANQIKQFTTTHIPFLHTEYSESDSYEINRLNQYDSVSGVAFKYDNNGSLTQDGEYTYAYDIENRLIQIRGDQNADLKYDPLGRLTQYTVDGNTTEFIYDGDYIIAEYQNGNLARRYVYGTHSGTPLMEFEGNSIALSNATYLHTNHQGSVIAASDANGDVEYINTYDAYGVSSTLNEGRFGYTGQMSLPDFNLYHYRARIYSPELGRFMQTDPIGYEDQMNLYAYVHNDPLTYTDPSGLCAAEGGGIWNNGITGCASLLDDRNLLMEGLGGGGRGRSSSSSSSIQSNAPKNKKENIVYRALNKGEDPSSGLNARNPDANATPAQHVNGKKDSQYISTTKIESKATEKYNSGNGVVKIDLNKVDNNVIDVSGGIEGASRRVNAYAKSDAEVLVEKHIPPKAIEVLE